MSCWKVMYDNVRIWVHNKLVQYTLKLSKPKYGSNQIAPGVPKSAVMRLAKAAVQLPQGTTSSDAGRQSAMAPSPARLPQPRPSWAALAAPPSVPSAPGPANRTWEDTSEPEPGPSWAGETAPSSPPAAPVPAAARAVRAAEVSAVRNDATYRLCTVTHIAECHTGLET